MKDMKLTQAEAKEMFSCEPSPGNTPKYPYGLSLCLDSRSLDKLGMDTLPEPGTQVIVKALATVTSVRMYQQQDGDKERGLDLQITDLEIGSGKSDADVAKTMYPGMA